MTRPSATLRPDGTVELAADTWRMTIAADGVSALLSHPDAGHRPLLLQLPGALDRTDTTDETLGVDPPELDTAGDRPVVVVRRRSSAWSGALTRVACTAQGPEISWEVRGQGNLRQTLALAARAALGGRGGGLRPSGHAWQTLFSPNPGPPRRLTRGAGESAVVGACGDARPGRGHWFFTPGPLCLALTEDRLPDDADPGTASAPHGWWTLSAGAPVAALTFTEMAYVPSDSGFHLLFAHEGHTRVDGIYRTPSVLVSPGHPDPYSGLRAHRQWLQERGWAPATAGDPHPRWWTEPMFCGWGAQMARARDTGRPAPQLSSRAEYDAHLAHLHGQRIVPGTVVVDDNWQRAYGRWEPDEERWPDLRGWIADRHARGQRVLLWWKAWATDGVPEEFCVRTATGRPVTLDPGHPGARDLLADNIRRMLSPAGLDADGLKIDFTADTPTGEGLRSHGGAWGIALLHEYLAVVHRAAKDAKADALIVTHTPHPAFADVTDMIRLNDMLRLDDPDPYAQVVPQMRMRAAVAAAGCPGLPVDTDDWCAPDREQWRAYTAMKDELGVPALYLATHLDRTGEPLEEFDYASIRRLWSHWRGRGSTRDRDGKT
ncbi:hypothetical protein [Streptomyces sp. NBC_01497]|uniref:hypothetical protein n=1 Tax=Streptomyces sp. NBC_01497 TaxID=2903885 RepID=UPI002E2F8232|nr:hypothetical protein [Streptomyces sp. NBC_01497]